MAQAVALEVAVRTNSVLQGTLFVIKSHFLDAYFKEQAAPAVALRTDGVEMAAAPFPSRGRRG